MTQRCGSTYRWKLPQFVIFMCSVCRHCCGIVIHKQNWYAILYRPLAFILVLIWLHISLRSVCLQCYTKCRLVTTSILNIHPDINHIHIFMSASLWHCCNKQFNLTFIDLLNLYHIIHIAILLHIFMCSVVCIIVAMLSSWCMRMYGSYNIFIRPLGFRRKLIDGKRSWRN